MTNQHIPAVHDAVSYPDTQARQELDQLFYNWQCRDGYAAAVDYEHEALNNYASEAWESYRAGEIYWKWRQAYEGAVAIRANDCPKEVIQ